MKYPVIFFLFTLIVGLSSEAIGRDDDPVVMTVGPNKVCLSEFEYLYRKSRPFQPDDRTIEDYARMYADYKLKVLDALSLGLDTTAAFRKEFEDYRRQLSDSLLLDRGMYDSLRMVAYSHYLENVDVGHILLSAETDPFTADSIAAAAWFGHSFSDLARRFSIDPLVVDNGGMLGYISAGQYPYFFEDVVYETPVGGVSKPFVSDLGLHIVKVFGRRDDRGVVKVSHILKSTAGLDAAGVARKIVEIDSLKRLLDGGTDFHTLASANTDDPSGRNNGGALPPFGSGMMVKEFEEAAFALRPGMISDVVASPFGFHIIICEERKPTPGPDELLPEIDRHMKIDGREAKARQRYLDKFRRDRGLNHLGDSALYQAALTALYNENAAYRNIVNEYRDGMLLYGVSNLRLWDQQPDAENRMASYFDANRDKYGWGDLHYKGYLVMATSDSIATEVAAWINKMILVPDQDFMNREIMKRFGKEAKAERVLAAKGANPIIDYISFGGECPPAVGRWSAFAGAAGRVIDKPEELDDVRARVVNDFQLMSEDEWLGELRRRYPVRINYKTLRRVKQ